MPRVSNLCQARHTSIPPSKSLDSHLSLLRSCPSQGSLLPVIYDGGCLGFLKLSCLLPYLWVFSPDRLLGCGPASGLRPVCASRAAPQARVGRNLSVPVSPTDSHLNVFRTISPINSQILPSSEVCSACDTLTKPAYNFLTRLVG